MKHRFSYKMEEQAFASFYVPETSIEYTVEAESLDDVCEAFGNYLKACGFVFDGYIGVVDDEA